MKNPIIDELRKIRDEHAKRFNYDVEAMGKELQETELWEKEKTVTLRGGRIVLAYPELHIKGKNRLAAKVKMKTRCKA